LEIDNFDLRTTDLITRKEYMGVMLRGWSIATIVRNVPEVEKFFNERIALGYEGIVVKNFGSPIVLGPCDWVKIKNKDQTDYEIVEIDQDKERIEVLVPCFVPVGQGFIHVGVKAPNRYKKYLKVGDKVTIEHQGVLDSGSLRHPVLIPKKEWK